MNEKAFSPQRLGILVAALVFIGGGIYFFQQTTDKKEQEGKSALYKVQKSYDEELAALPEADRVENSSIDVDVKFSKTVSELKGMIAAKSLSPRVLYEASLKLGTLYMDHGQAEKAIPALKDVAEFGKTAFQKASGYYLLGAAQERANLTKDALDSYQFGLAKDVDGLKGELLLGIVRANIKLGNPGQAKLYVEKLNKEAPGSKAAAAAESMIKGTS